MLKIQPYKSYNTSYTSQKTQTAHTSCTNEAAIYSKEESKKLCKKAALGYTLLGALALVGTIYGIMRKGKIPPKNDISPTANPLKEMFEAQMAKFPKDIDYRKELLKACGIREENLYKLRPVIGAEEYKNIVTEFSDNPIHYTPGKKLINEFKDKYDLDGVNAKTFRATMHMHTNNSDGQLTVQELLDKSAEYADEVYKAIKDKPDVKVKDAPFTIAITDHDTIEGCKEAVRIIASNPEKYKNLRVVLGSELSVENRMLGDALTTPVPIHMTTHGLNPYDKELNRILDEKKLSRINLMKELINKFTQKYPQMAEKVSFEEAEKLYPALKNKVSHVNYPLRDYFQFKIIFAECFEKNKALQDELKRNGINAGEIKYDSFINDYFSRKGFAEFYLRYHHDLKNYISKLLKISPEEAGKKVELTPAIQSYIEEAEKLCLEDLPKIDLQPAFLDMEEAINIIKKQPTGYMTWAHPACTGIGKCLKNSADSFSGMENLFRLFKEKGGERALAAEIHYPYFGELGNSTDWINAMKTYAQKHNFYFSGGLDTHGTNIFYSSI